MKNNDKEDIERLFITDVRYKKRTASGVYHRASRRGYIKGGVRTQSDFLSRKEKKQLNGEVKVYNIYDKYKNLSLAPSLKEIRKMKFSEARALLSFLQNNHDERSLLKHLGVSKVTLKRTFEQYKLEAYKSTRTSKIKIENGSITNFPKYDVFKELDNFKRYEIMKNMSKSFTILEISKYWDVSISTITKTKRVLNAMIENESKMPRSSVIEEAAAAVIENDVVDAIIDEDNKINIDNIEEAVQIKMETESNIDNKEEKIDMNKEENIIINNELEELKNQMKMLAGSVEALVKISSNKSEEIEVKEKKGFSLSINNEYKKNEIESLMTSLAMILSEDKKYNIKVEISELQ